jgi:hypothetical protein
MTQVKVGQVWEEVDPRFDPPRTVKVEAIDEVAGKAVIRSNPLTSATRAKLSRFNGKRGGYKLVKDVA